MRRSRFWIVLSAVGIEAMALPVTAEPDKLTAGEIIAGLQSADPAERILALSRGLKSDDRAVRTLTIIYSLKDSKTLHVSVTNYRGDAQAADFLANLPGFDIFNVKWNNGGRGFSGEFASKGRIANGTLSGESLSFGIEFVEIQQPDRRVKVSTCSATLLLNASRDALEGPLRCAGFPYRFLATVAL